VGLDPPAGVVFEPVMVGAVTAQVLLAGLPTVGPGHDVIQFGVGGFPAAAGEAAVHVAGSDVIGQSGGRMVGAAAVVEEGA
jgi:hypothetical protein